MRNPSLCYINYVSLTLVVIGLAYASESNLPAQVKTQSIFQIGNQQSNCKIDELIDYKLYDARKDTSETKCFVGAVYEHRRIQFGNDLAKSIEANLQRYEEVAKKASDHGASILVTPEDGILYGLRERIRPFLELVPDPKIHRTNPCEQRTIFKDCPILVRLSCMARKHSIYLVANYGTLGECPLEEQNCDRPQHNTDLVFDDRGNFISRYRKINTYIEPFDPPPEKTREYFDTPFGRIGLMTCFDMIFRHPGIDLVERDLIDTVVFPTWWYDELPILTAVQYQQAWSFAMKVNLLAANIHDLPFGSIGSGIYAARKGSLVNTGTEDHQSTLMLSYLNAHPRLDQNECSQLAKPTVIKFNDIDDKQVYRYKNMKLNRETDVIETINKVHDKISRCNKKVCCNLSYTIETEDSGSTAALESGRIVMIIRDGLRKGRFTWYEQSCFVTVLEDPKKETFLDVGIVKFRMIEVAATFNTEYIYPLFSHNVSLMMDTKSVSINCDSHQDNHPQMTLDVKNSCAIKTNLASNTKPISIIGFYGRVYDLD